MQIRTDQTAQRCEIWLTHDEGNAVHKPPAIQDAIARYRALGYRVCVYIGGTAPLLPNITALLERQSSSFSC